uniref:Uncharacterized protein n=1 Tax=Strigamia maritima TaxID=126957 RepID=T1IRF6_STRMM
ALSVGSTQGYKLFSLKSTTNLELIHENTQARYFYLNWKEKQEKKTDQIYIVERQFSNGLVATVSYLSDQKLILSHFGVGTEIQSFMYNSRIMSVKLNRSRLVTCLRKSLHIFEISSKEVKKIYEINDTPQNSRGLFALSNNQENCFLAYPASDTDGKVQIFDATKLKAVIVIDAHKGLLAALAFNSSGSKLATASDEGTIIRVFNTSDGYKIAECRRGFSPASIYSLSFSYDSLFLTASSNTSTIDIYKLETQILPEPELESSIESEGWVWEYFRNSISTLTATVKSVTTTAVDYIPQVITDAWNPQRHFASVQLESTGFKNICSLALVGETLCVIVASANGYLYIYDFNPISGYCSFIQEHSNRPTLIISPLPQCTACASWRACKQGICMQRLVESADVITEGLKAGILSLMNLASQGDQSSGVFFVNFNQDNTSLAVGTKKGYRLFSLNSVDKLEKIYENESEEVYIVERLFSSSLVATVSLSSPRKLFVSHFKKGTEICNYSYVNTVLSVKLNRVRLVVCLEESLYIHNIRDMKVLHTIRDTPPNPQGLFALSSNQENSYLAYPGSNTIGEVQIFDAANLQAKVMISAHDSPLAALAFNPSGTKLATASEKGTVIRVFEVQDGSKLFEFRRGVKRCVTIYSLAFSADSVFLCASSNTETVHVFKLENPTETKLTEEPQGWIGYFGQKLMQSAALLPSQVSDMLNQGRAFATVHLPFSGLKNVCSLAVVQKILRILVASADGYLYIYNLDPNEGGDCTLLKQHSYSSVVNRLDGKQDTPATTPAEVIPSVSVPAEKSPVSVSPSYASTVRKTETSVPLPGLPSYARIVKGNASVRSTSENDNFQEMASPSSESPIKGNLNLDDESEFPPMTQKND